MTIDWPSFTPWSSLFGGAIIGLAAGALILLDGRIAGIAGIVGGLFEGDDEDQDWRLAFVLGMFAAPLAWRAFEPLPRAFVDSSYPLLIAAGLVVGFGTRLGSGCTSGHGVCGLSRLSLRSLVATLTFIAVGALTVWLVRHAI